MSQDSPTEVAMLFDELIQKSKVLESYPPELHLCCPKLQDDDFENYGEPDQPGKTIDVEEKRRRIHAFQERSQVVYKLSLLMGFEEELAQTVLEKWRQRLNNFLKKCDRCVRNWHMGRHVFVKALHEQFEEGVVNIMEDRLYQVDKERIDEGLDKAHKLIEEHGPMTAGKLANLEVAAVVALLEALCDMAYLSQPENREKFNYVFINTQEKKPLRVPDIIFPTMTFFLFQEDPYRLRYARAAWEKYPPKLLTKELWDWSVNDHLIAAIKEISTEQRSDRKMAFWEGILLILPTLDEDLVMHGLRAMDVQPDLYNLACWHTSSNSEELLFLLLRVFCALMQKSPKAFWASLEQTTPTLVVETIFASPAFFDLLSHSLLPSGMEDDGTSSVPLLVLTMKTFILSLALHRRTELCQYLLHQLLTTYRTHPKVGPEGRATCTLAALTTLATTLDGFLAAKAQLNSATSLVNINQILELVVSYKDVICQAAELQPGGLLSSALSEAALAVIEKALMLDSTAIWVEWKALHDDKAVQQQLRRSSALLWDSFLELLFAGKTELAKAMLLATMPLRSIEQFKPLRNEPLNDPKKVSFNERYYATATAVSNVLERLSEFNPADLHALCLDHSHAMRPIAATLIHSEQSIQASGLALLKAITGEEQRSDAVNSMLEEHFESFLNAFSEAVAVVTTDKESNAPWSPMSAILRYSEDILNGLSDPAVGLLRSKDLLPGDVVALRAWWEVSWRTVNHAFLNTRAWHERIEKKTMEDFCRDNMEMADKLLAQDGLMASALGRQQQGLRGSGGHGLADGINASTSAMKTVLEPPRDYSEGFANMLQLKDIYLIEGIVKVLHKLLSRLKENGMELASKVESKIRRLCIKITNDKGVAEYAAKTNLTDQQRMELLKALGEDEDIEVMFLSERRLARPSVSVDKEGVKKQSVLDFSKADSTLALRAVKSEVPKPTSVVEKPKRETLAEKIQAKAGLKVEQKPVIASPSAFKAQRQKEKEEREKRNAAARAAAAALRGSSLQAKKDEIMVGSSSEEEDDDESEDDLAEITKKQRAGQLDMIEAEKRRQRALAAKSAGPVKKTKVQRSAKDMRARLIPPMDVLHQAILEWDIFHEGNDPPNGTQCVEVANAYLSPKNYKDTFLPLLVYEAWRSFVTAKDEATSKPFSLRVLNRMSVDRFVEVSTTMPASTNKDRFVGEGDLVILSKSADALHDRDSPHCLARIWKVKFKKENLEVSYRVTAKGNQLVQQLGAGSELFAVKITNMTTIEREYAALESLQYYDLMDEVLKAEPSPILKYGQEAIDNMMRIYQLNPGQAKAILGAKDNDGFTLIQGPPGTGKTKTIVAMVGALLTGHLKPPNGTAVQRPAGGNQGQQASVPKKLLVCAPSNAAVDELVLRLKQGVKTTSGAHHMINVIRLGRTDVINSAVKDVTLDELVKARIEGDDGPSKTSQRDQWHKEAGELKVALTALRPRLDAARAADDRPLANQLQRQFDEFKRKQAMLGALIDNDKDSGNTYAREMEIKKRAIQQDILDKAQVLCATLSGSGHEMFRNLNVEFETVIIDEAAQCVELSALIPLKYGCSKCILVGDPKQLPPTVLSQSAARFGYDQSLFVRMQRNHPNGVHLLDRQYRMHPEISTFPSKEFYEGRLLDGADMASLRVQPWHASALLSPYRFFDIRGAQERGSRGQSYTNQEEIKVAMQLYARFKSDYPKEDRQGRIGIITPYKAQLFALRSQFSQRWGDGIVNTIEFNTTDAFQGRECEIIIFSCVRASATGGIGFMTDIRRMNVGLTRAKSSLWVLGDSKALVQGEYWRKLIDDARARQRFTTGDVFGMLRQPGKKIPLPYLPPQQEGSNTSSPRSFAAQDEDVEMEDVQDSVARLPKQQMAGPSYETLVETAQQRPLKQSKPVPSLPETYTLSGAGPSHKRGPADIVNARHGGLIGGFNANGEVLPVQPELQHAPQVFSSADGASVEINAAKKRSADAALGEETDGNNTSKRMHTTGAIPTGPKAMMILPGKKAPKPPKQPRPPQPQDPAALQTLGLVPPERPPPPPAAPVPAQAPIASAPSGPKAPGPPKKKTAADPFIRRKPNKR